MCGTPTWGGVSLFMSMFVTYLNSRFGEAFGGAVKPKVSLFLEDYHLR